MPSYDPADRRSYRLTDPEVEAMWGLSTELLVAVEEGLAAAVVDGKAASAAHARAEFDRRQGRRKGATLNLLGFARAKPLRDADIVLLADRMLLAHAELTAGEGCWGLYRLACRLEETREAMGRTRRALMRGTVDPQRCYSVIGMAAVQRPTVRTLRSILHAAWRRDSVAVADGLAARWPAAIGGAHAAA